MNIDFIFFNLDKMGFQTPTRIQAQTIPVAMFGQHMYALIYHRSLIEQLLS
jgi:superfamily II DNA/RNA helicase